MSLKLSFEARTLNKKALYGVAIAVTLLLLVGVGGALTTSYAQNTNNEESIIQRIIVPLSLKLGNWVKCKPWSLGGFVQISPEYNETVMRILSLNSDVKSLLDQGYAVVSIRPVVVAHVQGDGTVILKAQKAVVVLSNGSTVVTYLVDIVSGSVTHIATINISAIKELGGYRIRGPRP